MASGAKLGFSIYFIEKKEKLEGTQSSNFGISAVDFQLRRRNQYACASVASI